MSGAAARWALREATAAEHERLDAAFARLDLADARDYRAFLLAHRRALPPLEAAVAAMAPWSGWRPRTPELDADLAALGAASAATGPDTPPLGSAAAWGVQYVLEGSRLGARFLVRQVGEGLPRAYLAAEAGEGGWPVFQQELDAGLAALGPGAADQAVEGARLAFRRFQEAANGAAPG